MSTTNINLSTINGAAYTPGGGGGSVSSFTNLFATNASTTNLFVSSINGAAYPPSGGGASTISTFTTLTTSSLTVSSISGTNYTGVVQMGSNPIILTDANHGLKFGLTSVGVDGPYLYGFNAGALGTTDGGDDVSLAWSQTEVNIYKTLDMEDNFLSNVSKIENASGDISINIPNQTYFNNGGFVQFNVAHVLMFAGYLDMNNNNITNVSSITSAGELSISATTNLKTSAVSTINTVAETVFTGGVSRQLVSDLITQPIIQYGQVSSSGSSGAVTVTIPTRYTSVSSYLPFACMADAPAAEIYVSTLTRQTFEIGWQNGGGGAQLFNWNTMGT
jgi:hypothetical protein